MVVAVVVLLVLGLGKDKMTSTIEYLTLPPAVSAIAFLIASPACLLVTKAARSRTTIPIRLLMTACVCFMVLVVEKLAANVEVVVELDVLEDVVEVEVVVLLLVVVLVVVVLAVLVLVELDELEDVVVLVVVVVVVLDVVVVEVLVVVLVVLVEVVVVVVVALVNGEVVVGIPNRYTEPLSTPPSSSSFQSPTIN